MKIRLVMPYPLAGESIDERLAAIPDGTVGPDVQVRAVAVSQTTELGSEYEETLRAACVVEAGATAEDDGFDAVVIDSVLDPGLFPLRSRLTVPVVGPGLAPYTIALTLGARFSVLATTEQSVHAIDKTLRLYELTDKCSSVRAVTGAAGSEQRLGLTPEQCSSLLAEANAAVDEDGAAAIVIGTTGMHQTARWLAERVSRPVLDPGTVALQIAERLGLLGLSHSKLAFPAPKRLQDEKLSRLFES
jgi:allantoin racemase